ncbi:MULTISPECIES: hypothetical protein [unclassified Vibrio]|uniref:hypothetical protein n=1 Tax=unclassified Vibrio TaxID=2614977 RepID=UPI000C83716B|nr:MULTISPECIES: hypothetical protein [unclassified Vibrio]PMK74070.1 hypothetical protein BCT92_24040 [Vibrio sp. 10N.261.52.E5]TKF77203.1 hypothetical protein FCV65_24550 [Vibrio sp. F13]
MKNIFNIFLLFTILMSGFSFAYEQDKVLSDCQITQERDLSKIITDVNDCIDEELDRDTEQAELIRRFITPVDLEETVDMILNGLAFFSFLMLFFTMKGIIKAISDKERSKLAQARSEKIFSIAIVFLIISCVSSVTALSWIIKASSDYTMAIPTTFLNTINHVKSQSDSTKETTLSASRTQFTQKALEMTQGMMNGHMCAVRHRQELMSFNTEPTYEHSRKSPQLACIEDFEKANANKSIADLDNRTLLVAAVKECSRKHGVKYKDCGYINTQSTLETTRKIAGQDVVSNPNQVVEKYANLIVDFTNEYVGYDCNRIKLTFGDRISDKYKSYCSYIKDGEIKHFDSSMKVIELEDRLYELNKSFGEELLEQFKSISLNNDYESTTTLLSFFGNISDFLSVDKYSADYQNLINQQLSYISFNESTALNQNNGRSINTDSFVDLTSDDVNSFYAFTQNSLNRYYNNDRLIIETSKLEFKFVEDGKLLFGRYTDATETENFKVDMNVLEGVQRHYIELMSISVATKLLAQHNIKQAYINEESAGLWHAAEYFALILALIANFNPLFTAFIFGLMLFRVMILLIETVYMGIIEVSIVIFSKKEVHVIFLRAIRLIASLVVEVLTVVIPVILQSVFVAIMIVMFMNIPLIYGNTFVQFVCFIVLYFAAIIYGIKKTVWWVSYGNGSINTTLEGFKGDMKKSLKDVNTILKSS